MKIESISIHIETEDTAIETVFTTDKTIAEVMNSKDRLRDLVFDIINNAIKGKNRPIINDEN